MIHMFCYGLTMGSNPSDKYCAAFVLFKEGHGMKSGSVFIDNKSPVTQQQATILAMIKATTVLNPGRQGVMIHTNIKTLADTLSRRAFEFCSNKTLLVYLADCFKELGRGFRAEYTSTDHPYMELAQQLAREQHDTHKS